MEKKISIGRINRVEIFAVTSGSGDILVPIRPICEAIGIDPEGQRRKLSEDEDLNSVADLRSATGTDGKQYKMLCIPLLYVYGWLFTINPKNVATEAKEKVRKYRMECYKALYNHFFLRSAKQLEANKAEIALLEEINLCLTAEKESRAKRKEAEKKLNQVRAARLDDQPTLF